MIWQKSYREEFKHHNTHQRAVFALPNPPEFTGVIFGVLDACHLFSVVNWSRISLTLARRIPLTTVMPLECVECVCLCSMSRIAHLTLLLVVNNCRMGWGRGSEGIEVTTGHRWPCGLVRSSIEVNKWAGQIVFNFSNLAVRKRKEFSWVGWRLTIKCFYVSSVYKQECVTLLSHVILF